MKHSVWSVVLAAGMGRRLSPVTGGVPKQFWRPTGSASLLDETLVRLGPVSDAARTIIVVDDTHREHVSVRSQYLSRGRVLFQPTDRGTAAGVLFGLVPVFAADPDAIVVLTPSDHGIGNATVFAQGISEAISHVKAAEGIVLLGVEPSAASDDLGWITLASKSRPGGIQPVNGFVEKPHPATARRLLASGAVWNTMVLVAHVKDLVALSETHLPEITATFLRAVPIPASEHAAFFRGVYSVLPSSDFSRHVLAPARDLLAYTWPASMGWSDLGTPKRLAAWLQATSPAQDGTSTSARRTVNDRPHADPPGRSRLAPNMQLSS
jgi:mannose-1-phosphate guanylyltransferase